MPDIDSATAGDNSTTTPRAECALPGVLRCDSCFIFCECEEHTPSSPLFNALMMILALSNMYSAAKNQQQRSRIVQNIRHEAEAAIKTHNAVLTGAGHETTGNGAPYHRVRLKT